MTSSSRNAEAARNPRPWEIWLAYVHFADHPEVGKVRPIVVIDHTPSAIIAAKITSANPQKQFLYCELADWKMEGLVRPSRAQTVPLFRVSIHDVLREAPLGVLTRQDRASLQAALNAAQGPEI